MDDVSRACGYTALQNEVWSCAKDTTSRLDSGASSCGAAESEIESWQVCRCLAQKRLCPRRIGASFAGEKGGRCARHRERCGPLGCLFARFVCFGLPESVAVARSGSINRQGRAKEDAQDGAAEKEADVFAAPARKASSSASRRRPEAFARAASA